MAYISEKLTEALGGKVLNSSRSTAITGWSPNNIKSLFITSNYILVGKHIGGFTVVSLDRNSVVRELQDIHRGGKPSSLDNVLTRRSFSCLEEIYVDRCLLGLIDLERYALGLLETPCRLRFFGTGDFNIDSLKLQEVYLKNAKQLDYSIVSDGNHLGLSYRETNNSNWYKNYYLRPKYYTLDRVGGELDNYFSKLLSDYENALKLKESELKKDRIRSVLKALSSKDAENIICLKRVDNLLKYLQMSTRDEICNIVLGVIKNRISKGNIILGFNNTVAKSLIIDEYLYKSYSRYGVIDTSGSDFRKSDIESRYNSGKGLLSIDDILDDVSLEVSNKLISRGYDDLVGMGLLDCVDVIPKGRLRDTLIKTDTDVVSIEGYFKYLSYLVGTVL